MAFNKKSNLLESIFITKKVPEYQFKLDQLDLTIKLNTLCFDCNGAQPVGAIRQRSYKVH